ncbi:hypothetical protein [Pseudomonas sp. NPDC089569]|uniref:hypothetical protein n=1 Tax=Pseudomonas sp. NPDC089569 TaxID=3390722 RepID=UPI003D00E5E1
MSRPMNKPRAAQPTPEFIGLMGSVPDSVMALIIEAQRLNGRINVTLTLCELQLLEVARRELSERGVCITFDVDESEKVELAAGISPEQAQAFMLRRNRVVSVEFKPGARGGNELTKNIPFFTSLGK